MADVPRETTDPIAAALAALVREVQAKRVEEAIARRRTMAVVGGKRRGAAA